MIKRCYLNIPATGIFLFSAAVIFSIFFASCSLSSRINKQANTILFKDSVISTGHIGISIYEPATNKYWYAFDADKYFVPASNTKLFTLYAAMKYLGDSLVGLRYRQTDSGIIIYPAADPTLLDPDFKQQLVFDFLKGKSNISYRTQFFTNGLGKGWAWDDYMETYMVQRSELPLYGNMIRVYDNGGILTTIPKNIHKKTIDNYDNPDTSGGYQLFRKWDDNDLTILSYPQKKKVYEIPVVPTLYDMPHFLADTLQTSINYAQATSDSFKNNDHRLSKIYSQPTDSLLKPMLYNSDNFFAEQSLLMVSNEHLGVMDVEAIIDTLLNIDLRDVPQKPRWVDGSGLSRYNLFTPQSFVYILNKIKNEFGMERLKRILPTGGQGTFKNYFQKDSSFIYAKTGSLSNHSAISGILISKKGKVLIFSILANQFMGSATKVRHSVEKFLEAIREKY